MYLVAKKDYDEWSYYTARQISSNTGGYSMDSSSKDGLSIISDANKAGIDCEDVSLVFLDAYHSGNINAVAEWYYCDGRREVIIEDDRIVINRIADGKIYHPRIYLEVK